MKLLKIGLYPIIVLFAWFVIKRYEDEGQLTNERRRIKPIFLCLISLIIGVYSMSFNQTFWWGDVVYYDAFFSAGLRFPDSIGLNIIYSILHLFTSNTDVLLFTVAFLSSFVMLLSYRKYEEAYPISLLFLFLTPFFIETCQVNLKQGIACGLAAFYLCYLFKRKYLQAAVFFISACLFHVTAGVILGLSFVAVKAISIRNNKLKILIFLIVICCFVFYDQIFALLQRIGQMIPVLGNKLAEYSSENGGLGLDSTGMIVLKGIPYYLISFIGILNRRRLKEFVKDYDCYLIISFLASASYLLSFRSYWMSRIIGYYWMTDLIFLGILIHRTDDVFNRRIVKYGIGLMLFVLTFRQLIQMY